MRAAINVNPTAFPPLDPFLQTRADKRAQESHRFCKDFGQLFL